MSLSLNLKAALQTADNYDSFNMNAGWFAVTGVCGHSYHLDNIQKWLVKSRTCPMCGKPWEHRVVVPIPLWPLHDTMASTKEKRALQHKLAQQLNVTSDKIFL
eukprot:TRINITY_DN8591_c0_g2_i2.p1 TRINITY_DN8591_c0_g2~~TRINITY_DN8591_c0_g2_i2.p1  ORF type:complete len:103 (-),score=14.81 TRINITY_DN8591_c0_g2_i2:97-405(-)